MREYGRSDWRRLIHHQVRDDHDHQRLLPDKADEVLGLASCQSCGGVQEPEGPDEAVGGDETIGEVRPLRTVHNGRGDRLEHHRRRR